MPDAQPLIRIENLSKRFKGAAGEVRALEDINLDISAGEIFGVIGMSGAGKSTLVRCVNLLEMPTAGNVYIDGRKLNEMTRAQLNHARKSIGMIFQLFNLLMQRTALQNVCFPLEISGVDKRAARTRANELLALVGLTDKADAYPAQLSGGQRQRVAIARALATNPKVLLCDEATSALDPATTREILALLKDINKRLGITIVVITHEMSVIEQICQRVAIIDDSRIVECGAVEEIFARPKSAAARRLVYAEDRPLAPAAGKRCCRIVFDGSSSFEPIVAGMVLEFGQTVNILFADTRNIDGKAFGQIVLQLPDRPAVADGMIRYLRAKGLTVEEVDGYV
jgi:D-methionine transport system ATP-binding protein